MSAFQHAGSVVDRGTDADIGGTATEIAVERQIDVMVGWLPDLLEQRDRAHHLAGLAVAALRDVARYPGALDCLGFRPGDTLDRSHLATSQPRDRHRTRAQRLAVDKHRAGTAERDPTAELGSGESEIVAQDPEQRR